MFWRSAGKQLPSWGLAKQLKDKLLVMHVDVIGCTDSTPMKLEQVLRQQVHEGLTTLVRHDGRGQSHVTHSRISHRWNISGTAEAEARVVKFRVLAGYISLRMADHPWKGRGTGHVIHFKILHPIQFLWNGWR